MACSTLCLLTPRFLQPKKCPFAWATQANDALFGIVVNTMMEEWFLFSSIPFDVAFGSIRVRIEETYQPVNSKRTVSFQLKTSVLDRFAPYNSSTIISARSGEVLPILSIIFSAC